MSPSRILCVAEKPSIAKAVAGHLSGGSFQIENVRGATYTKNYKFDFDFGPPWGNCQVIMTSVLGHLTGLDFVAEYKNWNFPKPERLFSAETKVTVTDDMKAVADNIKSQARYARALYIWTDCDREGENIGSEIRSFAMQGKSNIQVKRAKFSNIERVHIIQAAKRPVDLDQRQIDAVDARIELDLRIGAAFTRFQTLGLQKMGGILADTKVISYGSCQFPTLGFVVDRYLKVRNFIPEPFWTMKITHRRHDIDVSFLWRRNRLFDRAVVTILFERCLDARLAKVLKVEEKPNKKWKPLPLTTVELQKMATRFLHMDGQRVMAIAESLYQKGFISYPRTETDRFDAGINLRDLCAKQTADQRWGHFAQNLVDGAFQRPRQGRNDDRAHPPIHPIAWVAPNALESDDHRRLYEFIVRRFLACCSEDAQGRATDIDIEYGSERFHAHGLVVVARNYLDVYPYENWHSSQPMPSYHLGETFEPTKAMMTEGKTTAPGYLTEPDLLALMDANGIGTDATMADHIGTIKKREYVTVQPRNSGNQGGLDQATRGGRGGFRGGRGGRKGGHGGGNNSQVFHSNRREEFIPTTLGIALVEGYDNVGLETSLSKPFLRKAMEASMKDICEGRKTKVEVVMTSLNQYKQVYLKTEEEFAVLKAACRKYIGGL